MFENIRNVITRLPMDRLRPNLGGHIPSFPRHVPPRFGCHNGALNILQLWASGDRTCEPILRKFGKQTQIRTTMTVTWSNVFFNSKWRTAAMSEYIRNVITRLPMDRLRPNLGGHIRSCPRYVPHDSVACIEHSAVMAVRRPNAWTNFVEIWFTTAN